MCLLFESVRVENGVLQNLQWHQQRVDFSRRCLFANCKPLILYEEIAIPASAGKGIHKCRVIFDRFIQKVEFVPYQIPLIRSLRIVDAGLLEYNHKYLDRNSINQLFEQRGSYDDVLMAKNGLITDTSYCNVVIDTGEKLITPLHPLLRGVRRESLIAEGVIEVAPIRVEDLMRFKQVFLINAMLDLGELPPITLDNIDPGDLENSFNFEPAKF